MMFHWSLALLGFFAFNIPHSFATLQEERTPKIRRQRIVSSSEANDSLKRNAAAIKRKPSSNETSQKKAKIDEFEKHKFVDLDADLWESVSTETDQETYSAISTHTNPKNPALNKSALEKLNEISTHSGNNLGFKIGKNFFRIENEKLCAVPEGINFHPPSQAYY